MERELNELIEAWKICTNYTKSDQNAYRSAFEYVENFKVRHHLKKKKRNFLKQTTKIFYSNLSKNPQTCSTLAFT